MNVKKLLCVLATLLILPAAAAADDFSAKLTGPNGEGFGALVTSNGQVAYSILTNGVGTPNRAYIAQGGSVFLELNASFVAGSASGVTPTAIDLSPLEDNPGSYTLRVEGPGGNLSGTLEKSGEGDGGGGPDPEPEPEDCPAGYFQDPLYPDFCFRVTISAGGEAQQSQREASCIAETICVSGAVPGRSELFIRIIGPRPNGFLWPTLVRFTPSQVVVDIQQISTGATQTYQLDEIPPGVDELPGLQDRTGFLP